MSEKSEVEVEETETEETAEEVEAKEAEVEEADEAVEKEEASAKAVASKETYSKAEFEKAVKRRQTALDEKRQLAKELADLKKQHATKEERIKLEAEEKAAEQANRFKPALVRLHVAQEMAFLGLNKTQIEQIVKFVDMENVDVDLEDNSVEGVEGEVARIRETFPALFPDNSEQAEPAKKAASKKKAAPRADGADKAKPASPKSARDRIADQLRGGNR